MSDSPFQFVFITGSGRCGTTLTRNLLDGHSQLEVLPGEATDLLGQLLLSNGYSLTFKTPDPSFKTLRHALLGVYEETKAYPAIETTFDTFGAANSDRAFCLHGFLTEFMTSVVRTSKKLVVVDITNERIKGLLEHFPGAKVIHLLRHPFNTLNSHYRFHFADANSFGSSFPGSWNIPQTLERIHRSFEQARLFADHDHVKILRLEDLQERPRETITDVLSFIGVGFEDVNLVQSQLGQTIDGNSTREKSRHVVKQPDDWSCLTENDLFYAAKIATSPFYDIADQPWAKNGYAAFVKRQLGFSGNQRVKPHSLPRFMKVILISWAQYIADVAGKNYLQFALGLKSFMDRPCL